MLQYIPCSSCIANKCFCEHMVNPIQKICQSLPFLLFLVKCPCRQPIYGSRFHSPAGNESFKASLSLAKVFIIKSFGGQFIKFINVTINKIDKMMQNTQFCFIIFNFFKQNSVPEQMCMLGIIIIFKRSHNNRSRFY